MNYIFCTAFTNFHTKWAKHWVYILCSLCGRDARFYCEDHEMADGVCVKCGYSRDRAENGAEDETVTTKQTNLPYILLSDGTRLAVSELPLENDSSERRALVLAIEDTAADRMELHLTAEWLRDQRAKNVQALYLYVNGMPVPVTESVDNGLTAMTEAGIDELVLTFIKDGSAPGGYALTSGNMSPADPA